jgi:hypothetical protein
MIRLMPRSSRANLLVGAVVQGAEDASGPWTTLHTVGKFDSGEWYSFTFPEPVSYKFYRVAQPGTQVFNVAEIEFLAPVAPKNSVYENINPKIRITEAQQSYNSNGWLDTRLKIKADYDCEVQVAVTKVLDVDNKVDTTIEDSKTLSLKANQEAETFLSAKWNILKDITVSGRPHKSRPEIRHIRSQKKHTQPQRGQNRTSNRSPALISLLQEADLFVVAVFNQATVQRTQSEILPTLPIF